MAASPRPAAKPAPTPRPDPLEVIRRAHDLHSIRRVNIGVSCGKDATATLALCIDIFGAANVRPFFMYMVPGLSFQEKYLAYLERLFSISIIRLPHWVISTLYRESSFRHPTGQSRRVPAIRIRDIESHVRKLTGIDWFATGEKAIDSLERNAQLRSTNAINLSRRKFWPIAYWNHQMVFDFLKHRHIALPSDYSNPLAQRSFGGLWYRDVAWIRDRYPEDWLKIVRQFPFIEAQILRYELREQRAGKVIEQVEQPEQLAAAEATDG